MNGALAELLLRSVGGRLRRWLRLLRNPRYLIGFLIGTAYLAWLFGRPLIHAPSRAGLAVAGGAGMELAASLGPAGRMAAALALAVVFTLTWLLLPGRPLLRLSQAEIEILMPAPLARRKIIGYALLKDQPPIVFGSLVVGLRRPALLPAVWALLNLANLQAKACRMWKARLKELPRARAWAWRLAGLALLAAYWTGVALAGRELWAGIGPALDGAGDFTPAGLGRLLSERAAAARPLAAWLTPFRLVLAPALAASAGGRTLGLAFVIALVIAHHYAVVGSRVRFEEASLENARRRAARRDPKSRLARASRAARCRQPFRLRPAGRPEMAIVWKNTLALTRQPLVRLALLAALGLAAAAGLPAVPQLAQPVTFILAGAVSGALFVAVFAGMMVRKDFRLDLKQVELLRAWPVAPRRLFVSEVLVPAAVGWATALGATAGLLVLDANLRRITADRLEGARGLIPAAAIEALGVPDGLALPLMCLAGLLPLAALVLLVAAVQNAGALAFPGWIALGPERPRGPAAMGQNIVQGLAIMLVLLVALVPAGLAVGLLAAGHLVTGLPVRGWEAPLAGLAAALPILAEAYLVIVLGGRLWARLDPSEILAEL